MVDPNTITPGTNKALREAAAKYFGHVIEPRYMEDTDGFMCAYTDLPFVGTETMVAGTEDQLAIHMRQDLGWDESVIVKLSTGGVEGTASIMKLVEQDDADAPEIVFDRYMTEREGEELCMDLHNMVARMPVDNLRTVRQATPPSVSQ